MLISPKLTILNSNKRNRVSCQCHWHKPVMNWNGGMPSMDRRTRMLQSFIPFVFGIKHHTCTIVIQTIRFGIESASECQNIDELIPSTQLRGNNENGMLVKSPHLCTKRTYFLDINEFEWYALG